MKAYHTLVVGDSGSGKTTYCNEMHQTVACPSVYLTPQQESGIAGKRVRGREALDTAVSRADNWSAIKCKWYGADYPDSLATVREWAYDIREFSGYPVQIIVDECQESNITKGTGPLKAGLHSDRDKGIKWVPASQDPTDLRGTNGAGYAALKQCNWIVWCGPAMSFHKGFLNYYNLSDVDFPDSNHQYIVLKPTIPPKIIYRGSTKRKYAV